MDIQKKCAGRNKIEEMTRKNERLLWSKICKKIKKNKQEVKIAYLFDNQCFEM